MNRIFIGLVLMLLNVWQAKAQTQVIDLRTGILNGSGTPGTKLSHLNNTPDDTWTVCLPGFNHLSPTSYGPVYCGNGASYPTSPNVKWISPYIDASGNHNSGAKGLYYYRTTFNFANPCGDSVLYAEFNFRYIAGDDTIIKVIINGNSYPVSYRINPLSTNIILPIIPSHIQIGQNEILLCVDNIDRPQNPNGISATGIHVDGELNFQVQPAPIANAAFSATVTNGTLQATGTSYGSHTWEVYGSMNGSPGSYIYIGTYNTSLISADDYPCYKVRHWVETACGEDCAIQNICGSKCDECGPLQEPQSLVFQNYTFHWDPVPGAVAYQIEVILNDPECCNNASGNVAIYMFNSTTNFYQPSEIGGCFSWRVKAICPDGSSSISRKKCNIPPCFVSTPSGLMCNETQLPPIFSWLAVPGAAYYEIEIITNDAECCGSSGGLGSTYTFTTTSNSYQPSVNLGNCFSWRIKAFCADGGFSVSIKQCATPGVDDFTVMSGPIAKRDTDPAVAVQLFPNPAKGSVTIEIEGKADETYTISIFDMQGKLVKTFAKEKAVNHKARVKWNTESLANGTYLVKIITSDKQVVTQKLAIE